MTFFDLLSIAILLSASFAGIIYFSMSFNELA